jgi:hypothetical protein
MATASLPAPAVLSDFAPMAERAVLIDPLAVLRFRGMADQVAGFVRLPYEVIAGRAVATTDSDSYDATVSAVDFLQWVDGGGCAGEPPHRDAHWLSALPPRAGWQRIETVPDTAVRDLVRAGAQLARDTTTKPGQEALVKAIVLTATAGDQTVDVPLGALSGLTRMGFLPPGSSAAVDIAPGWIRLAAPFGSTFVSSGGNLLGLLGGFRP